MCKKIMIGYDYGYNETINTDSTSYDDIIDTNIIIITTNIL